MKITLLTQPFDSENSLSRLGDKLVELLNSTEPIFDQIWVIAAFANQQAIKFLIPYLEVSRNAGATIQIMVGIDHQGTSIEALQILLESGIETKVAHNNQPGHTFHPKIYLFEATGLRAELFIGSHNLTEGGLFSNYEASTQLSFDLTTEYHEYEQYKQALGRFLNPPDAIMQSLTSNLIDNIIARGEIISEAQRRETTRQSSAPKKDTANETIPNSLFGNEPIPKAPYKPIKSPKITLSISSQRGKLVWEKEGLPLSDVQSQAGHPTGGLRLTQAEWTVNDLPIDQTSYFRYDLFGSFEWSVGKRRPSNRETTVIVFEVYILGRNYGVHELTISHKPSGEAGQRNYTTMLHWGALANTIRDLQLGGRTFRLYAPLENDIFTLEIT